MRFCSALDWASLDGEFIALWTSGSAVYALFAHELASTPLIDNAYPALSPRFAGAAWFETLALELNDHAAAGAVPLPERLVHIGIDGARLAWPEAGPSPADGAHRLALGPVRGDITEPAYLRFALRGETVLGLEARLGYSHKGTLGLMRGKSPRLAARFAARISGDATVAHSLAFAEASEAVMTLQIPPRARLLRVIMGELERVAGHVDDLGQIMAAAGDALLAERFALHCEASRAAAFSAFGHRLMMDVIIPGGLAIDIAAGGTAAVIQALRALAAELPMLSAQIEAPGGPRNRLSGIGVIAPERALQFALGGVAGRASGRPGDARLQAEASVYAGYDLRVPVETEGDAAARCRIRLKEIAESIRLIEEVIGALPDGPVALAPSAASGEALGVAESARGPVWVWQRLDAGLITDVFIADPSVQLWALLPEAARSGALSDFPLIERSLNPSASAVDL